MPGEFTRVFQMVTLFRMFPVQDLDVTLDFLKVFFMQRLAMGHGRLQTIGNFLSEVQMEINRLRMTLLLFVCEDKNIVRCFHGLSAHCHFSSRTNH